MKTALAAALALVLAGPCLAQSAPDAAKTTRLSLSASGEVKAVPDMARITLGVTTQAPTATGAMSSNAAQMNAVVAALRRHGIADRDMQTSGLNLNAQYVYAQNQPPKLTGYQATNQAIIVVRETDRLGADLDAAAAAGANRIDSIAFGLADPQAAEDEARRRAVKALQAKAKLYAEATGYRIVRLASLSEGSQRAQTSTLPRVFAVAKAAVPPPVSPGELTVRIDIAGVYELAK